MPPAASVCMAMSINSSLRTSGEQTNKCSFRHGSNLLRTTAPLCFLLVSQAATPAWLCQSLISAHARGQFHVQMLVEAHTASRPESFGIRSLKQVVTSPGQLNNSFRDLSAATTLCRAWSPAVTLTRGWLPMESLWSCVQVNMPLLLSYTAICFENSTWCQCFTGFLLFHVRRSSFVSGRERRIFQGSGGKLKRAPAKCTWVRIFIPSHGAVLPARCSALLSFLAVLLSALPLFHYL